MNFGKKGIASSRKKLTSHKDKFNHAFGVNFLRICLIAAIGVGICGISLGLGAFRGILANTPAIEEANIIPVGYATYMYDSNGTMIQKLTGSTSNRVAVSIDDIPLNMQHAIVAIEDERFYQHNGIDIKGILRAGLHGIARGFHFNEGASTLTQQLLKNNVFSNWTNENKIERVKRKVQEQSLALQLEASLTKEGKDTKAVILENYLNTINLGAGTFGVQAAANKYFNKSISELSLSECAVLAAIPQNPTLYNPINNPEKNAKRRSQVLEDMLEQGYISDSEYQEALTDNVYKRIKKAQKKQQQQDTVYSYFVDATIEQVLADLQEQKGYTEVQAYNALYSGGLRIHTTQDASIQAIMDDEYHDPDNFPANSKVGVSWALTVKNADGEMQNYSKEMMQLYFREEDSSFNLLFDSEQEAQSYIDKYKKHILSEEGVTLVAESCNFTMEPQSSMTIIDQSNGHVKAIIGGRGEKTASLTLNRATDSARQPGSTFKILSAYAPALENGMTLASVYKDEYYTYENGTQVRDWTGSSYLGNITIRKAIEQSVNVVAVKVLTELTPRVGYDLLLDFGFTTLVERQEINGKIFSDIHQPLALGGITHGVTNLELTAAYATLANGGIYNRPIFYTTVTDSEGKIILENGEDSHRVVTDSTAYLLTSAMEDVVTKGTGTNLRLGTDMPLAGKTGTTSDYNDVWFAGYTPYYTAVVWAGYDGNQKLAKENNGRTFQQNLWRKIMAKVHEDLPVKGFKQPSSVQEATVCRRTGLLAGSTCPTVTEYFTEPSIPDKRCTSCYAAWKKAQEEKKKKEEERKRKEEEQKKKEEEQKKKEEEQKKKEEEQKKKEEEKKKKEEEQNKKPENNKPSAEPEE